MFWLAMCLAVPSVHQSLVLPVTGIRQLFNSVPTSSSGNETATFQIYGLNEAQNQTLIGEYGNGNVDLSGLDASQYPYLKLNFVTEDQEEFTPAQLKKWRVIYDGVPEGILYPADEIPEATMEYQEGEIPSYDFFLIM